MRLKIVAFLVLAIAAAWPAHARDSLPGEVLAVVSSRSPMRLLEDIDELAVLSTAGTASTYPGGMLPMLSMMFLPPVYTFLDADKDVHVVFFKMKGSPVGFVVLGNVDSYDHYLDMLGVEEGDVAARDGVTKVTDDNGAFYLAKVGDTMALVADSLAEAGTALEIFANWLPRPDSDHGLTAVFNETDAFASRREILAGLGYYVNKLKRDYDSSESPAKIYKDREKSKERIFAAVDQAVVQLTDEVSGFKGGKIELDANADGLVVRSYLQPGDNGLFADMLVHAGTRQPGEHPLRLAIDADSGFYTQNTSGIPGLLDKPGLVKTFVEMGYALLDFSAEDEAKMHAGFRELMRGEMVQGEFDNTTFLYQIADDPDTYMEGFTDVVKSIIQAADLLGNKLEKDGLRMDVAVETDVLAGMDVKRIRLVFSNDDFSAEEFEKLLHEYAGVVLEYVLVKGKQSVILIMGALDEDAFKTVIANESGAAAPFVKLPEMQAMEDRLRHRQLSMGGIKSSYICKMVLARLLVQRELGISAEGRAALAAAMDSLIVTNDLVGFGWGSDGGYLAFDAVVPPGVIKNMVQNYEVVRKYESVLYDE